MQSFDLPQQRFGGVRLSPHAGRVFVRLGERRIDMDGAEDLVQAEAVLHGGDELHDQVAGVFADEGGAEESARNFLKLPKSALTAAYHAWCDAVCVNW